MRRFLLMIYSLLWPISAIAQQNSGVIPLQVNPMSNNELYIYTFKSDDVEYLWLAAPKLIDRDQVLEDSINKIQRDGMRGELIKSKIPEPTPPPPGIDSYKKIMRLNVIAMQGLKKELEKKSAYSVPLVQSLKSLNSQPALFENLKSKLMRLKLTPGSASTTPIVLPPAKNESGYASFEELDSSKTRQQEQDLRRLGRELDASVSQHDTSKYQAIVSQILAYQDLDARRSDLAEGILARTHSRGFLIQHTLQAQIKGLDLEAGEFERYALIGVNELLLENQVSFDKKILGLMLIKASLSLSSNSAVFDPEQIFTHLVTGWDQDELYLEISKLNYFGSDTATVKIAFEKLKSLSLRGSNE